MKMSFEFPTFEGPHSLELVSGEIRLVNLVGHFQTTMGIPIYLVDNEGTMYNYDNIISFRKLPKVGM